MASVIDGRSESGTADRRARIDLSRLAPFDLAGVTVEPATRQVTGPDGATERVEPRVMQVLTALAREPGTVLSRDDLIASCWAGTHVGEDAVSRVVVRARRLGEGIGAGRFVVETLPRVGYRLVLPVPEAAAVPDAPPAAATPVVRAQRRRSITVAVAFATVVLLAAAGWWLWRPAGPRDLTIAVARFQTGGVSPDTAVALDGELRARLDEAELAVRARDADFTLSGSVARAGDLVHYTASLDDAATGETVATLARDLPVSVPAKAFARAIGGALGCLVQGIARYPGRLPADIQRLWGQYCDAMSLGPDGTGRALDLARRLRAASPDFHGGWQGTAYTVGLMGMADPSSVTPALRAEALAAAGRFVALQPDFPRAWETLASATPADRPVRREALLRKAIATGPERCGCALQALGDFLLQSGRIAEAGRFYRRGTDQDRAGLLAKWRRTMQAYLAGRTAEGDATMRAIERLTPGVPNPRAFEVARWTGRWRAAADAVPPGDPAMRTALREAMLALASGDRGRIDRAGAVLERLPVPQADELLVTPVLARLGRGDAVFALLERSRRDGGNYAAPGRNPGFTRPMLFDPGFRPLYDDPRFAAFLERAGFIRYWRDSRRPPDICTVAGAPAFCRLIKDQ